MTIRKMLISYVKLDHTLYSINYSMLHCTDFVENACSKVVATFADHLCLLRFFSDQQFYVVRTTCEAKIRK
jgi:hypothetical protein